MTISRLLRQMHIEGGKIESLEGNRADYNTFPLSHYDEFAVPVAAFFSRNYQALAFIVEEDFGARFAVKDDRQTQPERDDPPRMSIPRPSEIVSELVPYRPDVPIRGWNRELRLLCEFMLVTHARWRQVMVVTWNLTPKRRAIVRAAIRRRWNLTVLRVNSFERWVAESRRYAGVRLIRPEVALVPESPQQRAIPEDAARQREAHARVRLADLTPAPEHPRVEKWNFPWKEGVRKAINESNKIHTPLVWFQPPEEWNDPRD
jgi:hypothetical protein